jgi:single stranded DNA-binding protein
LERPVWKKQESVDYHNVVFFGKQAEVIAQWMHKGNALMVEGRISTRSWDGPDGKKNYRTEIVGENFQFGPEGWIASINTKSRGRCWIIRQFRFFGG